MSLWIMVAGPYSSGGADPEQRALNLRRSRGADDEMRRFEANGRPVFHALSEVPGLPRS